MENAGDKDVRENKLCAIQFGANDVLIQESKAAVNSAQLTSQPGPRLIAEVWDIRIGVLQFCDKNQPQVNMEIREEVELGHEPKSKGPACK